MLLHYLPSPFPQFSTQSEFLAVKLLPSNIDSTACMSCLTYSRKWTNVSWVPIHELASRVCFTAVRERVARGTSGVCMITINLNGKPITRGWLGEKLAGAR